MGPEAHRPTGELLREARKSRGWGQLRLISELRRCADRRGKALPSDASVKRRIASWENGHSVPDEFYGQLLCETLGRDAAELGLGAAPPEEAFQTIDQLWRADLHGDEPLLRSEPSQHAWSEAALRWLVAREASSPSASGAGSVQVGPADVAMVKATTEMFAQLDDRFGGGHARHAVVQYLSRDVAPLLAGRYTEAVGRALFSAVAEATLLAGWMAYDSCLHGLAQRYFLQALRLAQDGGDRCLAGSVLSAMSHQATFLGNGTEAATLARAARMGVSGLATPTLMAQFYAMEARALARTGDTRGCDTALSEAAALLERRGTGEDPEWISYFDQAELAAEAAHCFRDVDNAEKAVARAESAMSGSHVRSDFFAKMVLADAYVRADGPEEGCRVALDALGTGAQLKSQRCARYLAEFEARLKQRSAREAVRDFGEQAAGHRLWQAAQHMRLFC